MSDLLSLSAGLTLASQILGPGAEANATFPGLPEPSTKAQNVTKTQTVDGILTIEWKFQSVNVEAETVEYTQGIRATYGPTVVVADKLTLFLAEGKRYGIAEGHVKLTDPEGVIHADRLIFRWRENTGEAENVKIVVNELAVEAKSIQVKPGEWTLIGAKGVPMEGGDRFFQISSDKVTLLPGKYAKLKPLRMRIIGIDLFPIPYYRYSLDRRARGWEWPSISSKRGDGIGVSWGIGQPLDDQTQFQFGFGAFPNRYPNLGGQITHSFLDPTVAKSLAGPRSELGERFGFGYFENVNVRSLNDERQHLSAPRRSLTLGSTWNQIASDRPELGNLSKPWEVVFEEGGVRGGMAGLLQLRVHNIGNRQLDYRNRTMAQGTILLPGFTFANGFFTQARLDGAMFSGGGTQSAWGRAQIGFQWSPASNFAVGAAYSVGADSGQALFQFDRLNHPHMWSTRLDVNLGSTKLSGLAKYSVDERRWFDHEFSVRHAAGFFEPYFVWRRFPRDMSWGIEFRVGDWLERLKDRDPKRKASAEPKPPR